MKFEDYLKESEITGKVTMHGGEWFYRKPNSSVRYGPYESATKAAQAARAAGVRMD